MKTYQDCNQNDINQTEVGEEINQVDSLKTTSIDNKKMESLYNMIINEVPLTKENMLKRGFSEEEIIELLETKTIKLTESNKYTLSSVEKLYWYGVRLLLTKSVKMANECFKKCYEIDPTHRESCLQILYGYIRLNEYNYALDMLSYIETISSKEQQADNNLYLYLLSKLTVLPEEYQQRVQNIKLSSVLTGENFLYQNKAKENELRKAIIRNKYKYALNLLNDILATEDKYLVSQTLLKELLLQSINVEAKFKARILHFARTKKYILIVLFFENKMKRRKLLQTEKGIYLITNQILEITRTKNVFPPIKTGNSSMYEAVENRNYEEAMQLNLQFLEEHHFSLEDDIANILLTDLNNLVSNILTEKIMEFSNSLSGETQETLNYETSVKTAEEIAYYINAERLSLENATKTLNLTEEQILLIKLVYARDYFIEGEYPKGDLLLYEVENNPNKTNQVIIFLNEIKTNRESYKDIINPYTRKKVNLPSGNSY